MKYRNIWQWTTLVVVSVRQASASMKDVAERDIMETTCTGKFVLQSGKKEEPQYKLRCKCGKGIDTLKSTSHSLVDQQDDIRRQIRKMKMTNAQRYYRERLKTLELKKGDRVPSIVTVPQEWEGLPKHMLRKKKLYCLELGMYGSEAPDIVNLPYDVVYRGWKMREDQNRKCPEARSLLTMRSALIKAAEVYEAVNYIGSDRISKSILKDYEDASGHLDLRSVGITRHKRPMDWGRSTRNGFHRDTKLSAPAIESDQTCEVVCDSTDTPNIWPEVPRSKRTERFSVGTGGELVLDGGEEARSSRAEGLNPRKDGRNEILNDITHELSDIDKQ